MSEQRSFGATVKFAWDEGLARHVVVSSDERTVLDLPLTVVLLIAVFVSPLVAVGVIVALVLGYRIEMRRTDRDETTIIMDEAPLRDAFRSAEEPAANAVPDDTTAVTVLEIEVEDDISAGDSAAGSVVPEEAEPASVPTTVSGADPEDSRETEATPAQQGQDASPPPAGEREGETKPGWNWEPPT